MRTTRLTSSLTLLTAGIAWAVIAACGSDDAGSAFSSGSGDASSDGPTTNPGFGDGIDAGPSVFSDFSATPLVDTSDGGGAATPANAAELFAAGGEATGDGSSPCLAEPEVGSILPRNWLRPRFSWAAAKGANLFEIRLHAANQTNDLVVYTAANEWTMPKELWDAFRMHSAGAEASISIRGGTLANGKVSNVTQGSHGAWGVAPVDAPGSIVYWRIVSGTNVADLKGFSVGDDSVRVALEPDQVKQKTGLHCVGCHTSSPDGKFAIFSSDGIGGYSLGIASIESASLGDKPSFLTSFGQYALENQVKGISTAAAPLWTTGKHLVVASWDGSLRWVNLDATSAPTAMGEIARTGDPKNHPNSPNLSHDGTKIVYVSAASSTDGRPSDNNNDVYVVPFNDGAGGAATPLAGAAETTQSEYYPSFSPDDKLVAFTRVPAGQGPYSSPNAEIAVVGAGGGTAQRLAANDPPACSGKKSPGVENSWPKWAPAGASSTVDGKTYHWLVFSSTRVGSKRQLFMAPVVVDAEGKITTYNAVYLWNQPADENNHTPAWDVFAIPPSGVK